MMEQLRRDVLKLLHEVNMVWNDELRNCRDSDKGIDLLKINEVVSRSVNKELESCFGSFKVRLGNKPNENKKKFGLFG